MTAASPQQGTWETGMPYLCLGSGPPLAYLPGLTAHHGLLHGMDRRSVMSQIKPYARHRRVWWINRRPGLEAGVTMADLARDYADALRSHLVPPVDVLGMSTGGSIALQLAADHPEVVKRLVLVSVAYRLGPRGQEAQRRAGRALSAGRPRQAGAALIGLFGATRRTQRLLAVVGWAFGRVMYGDGARDMVETMRVEDSFDVKDRLSEITSPALVIGGVRDAAYGPTLFAETAALIPQGELLLYKGKGHLATLLSRRLPRDVLAFLARP